jgi:hypothetical protein
MDSTRNPKRDDPKAQPLAQINHSRAENKKPDPELGEHGPVVSEPNSPPEKSVSGRRTA